MAASQPTLLVTLANSGRSFTVSPSQKLLEAALAAGLRVPHSCGGGNCGACKARLLRGDVHYPNGTPLGLSEEERSEGFVLLCQASADSDLLLELVQIEAADAPGAKRLPCRIERACAVSHDVMQVLLRLPAAESFQFQAGQYVDIILGGGRRRSYSIASAPSEARVLELHVRQVAGGRFSEMLFHAGMSSSLLEIEGPLGRFGYRDGTAPMLLVGGGTGLAPLLSILRHVIGARLKRDIILYWGVRSESDLYARHTLLDLAAAAPFDFIPVLSEPAPDWSGRCGYVHEAALQDIADIARYEVYAAGPPPMIEAVRREFTVRGVPRDRLFYDSFDYATEPPGAPPRHRSTASSSE